MPFLMQTEQAIEMIEFLLQLIFFSLVEIQFHGAQ